jgi:hypothetical protein
MHAIRRIVGEFMGVLVAGFLGFFLMLAYVAGFLIWFCCGLACIGFLLVALFSMVVCLSTHDAHAFRTMLGYFVYAAGAFAVIAMLSYYKGKLMDRVKIRWERRNILSRRRWSRLADDARFEA